MMRLFRRFKDLGVEGARASYYDKACRDHRLESIKAEAREAAQWVKNGDSILELAPGPGYLSIELSKLGDFQITGLDISGALVEIARKNAREAGVEIDFQRGNAANMPFPADHFNFIVCVLAFKNFKEPLQALNEMHRVLKPGGTALLRDLNRESPLRAVKAVAESMGLRGFQASVAGMIQRGGAYSRKEYEGLIGQSHFREYDIQDTEIGFSIHLKK